MSGNNDSQVPSEIPAYEIWMWPGHRDLSVQPRLKIPSLKINSISLEQELEGMCFYLKMKKDYGHGYSMVIVGEGGDKGDNGNRKYNEKNKVSR